jgi:DNA-directed RNA polymerase specialized sigma subunit
METINEHEVDKIVNELSIRDTYLDKDDIEQEIRMAIISSHPDVRKYISILLSNSKPVFCQYACYSDPADQCIRQEKKARIIKFIEAIIERSCSFIEKAIIRSLYGLYDGRCYDYAELASFYNISETQIKKIEKKALNTIRSAKGINKVRTKLFHLPPKKTVQ